jgi:hypothetical protein
VTGSYIAQIGTQIRAMVPSELLPEGETDELFLFCAVLALAKGDKVDARDIHNAWAAWMTTRDATHGSIVPYQDLPADVRRKDEPFLTAVRDVARDLRKPNR